MTKKPPSKSKNPEPDIVRLVVEDAAKDLRRARDDLQEAHDEHAEKTHEVNQEFKPLTEATQEAQTHLRAHERYKEHMPKQAWDKENLRLQRAADDAEARQSSERDRLLKVLEPYRDREEEARQRVGELEQEWRVHERTARVAGIDADALLTCDWDLDAEEKDEEE